MIYLIQLVLKILTEKIIKTTKVQKIKILNIFTSIGFKNLYRIKNLNRKKKKKIKKKREKIQ